MLNIKD